MHHITDGTFVDQAPRFAIHCLKNSVKGMYKECHCSGSPIQRNWPKSVAPPPASSSFYPSRDRRIHALFPQIKMLKAE